jgi:hypothetical protein
MTNINRREFLRRMSLISTGLIAADQLEILEKLTHVRRFFPSTDLRPRFPLGCLVTLDKNGRIRPIEPSDPVHLIFGASLARASDPRSTIVSMYNGTRNLNSIHIPANIVVIEHSPKYKT